MKVLAMAVGVILFVAGDAGAQPECSRTYYGEEHSGDWEYLTIDATYRGQPTASGIGISNQPTKVCGHNGGRSAEGGPSTNYYCGAPAKYEWRQVYACGSGGSGGSGRRVQLSMANDSEWVMEDAGPTQVTVKAALTGDARVVETRVDVRLDPHEASTDDFEASERNFEIVIPENRKSGSHTFTFTPVDDDKEERDENLMFTGDTREPDGCGSSS